jgi:hypothetical protein
VLLRPLLLLVVLTGLVPFAGAAAASCCNVRASPATAQMQALVCLHVTELHACLLHAFKVLAQCHTSRANSTPAQAVMCWLGCNAYL